MKALTFKLLIGLFISALIYSCANIGYPEGGPKDEESPVVKLTNPPNFSTKFKGGKVNIYFNEFVQLKDITEKFIVSPPLDKKPSVNLRGESIYVDMGDSLKPNTTYTLDFADGIADNNEGNPLGNFKYVFSTGDALDSLNIQGHALDAFSSLPLEKVQVFAYSNHQDSVPLTIVPDYVALTDSAGHFSLSNLKAGTYKLFALIDGNRDYKYNGPGEIIGFFDTLLTPTAELFQKMDSISPDSSALRTYTAFSPADIHINLFEEANPLLYLTDFKRPRREKLEFNFSYKRNDDLKIKFLEVESNNKSFLEESNVTKDSLSYWIADSNIYKLDTLTAVLNYFKTDTTNQLVNYTDTLKLNFKNPKKAKQTKKQARNSKPKKPIYNFKSNIKSTQELNKIIKFEFNEPLAHYMLDSIHLVKIVDTLEVAVPFTFEKDTALLRSYHLNMKLESETQYKLDIDSATFENIYGIKSNVFSQKFKTKEREYYGKILLTVNHVEGPVIIQLIENNKSENLIQSIKINSDQIVTFDYLEPKTYIIKVIEDWNGNGKWDTGNYKLKRQPETVHYFRKEIKVRSNWDVEENIVLSPKH
ncbi:Ig-like domain-containing protein [Ancylomarina sp. 16SWW S1-10-2]|uniref:Ig-like domain-containing protein n=1 Tax=Ancylomarina sp. 16SWW S1-10-2 TaxID=2499681 RepID=UPI0012AD5FB9|nr:Ig-like domain-containing protein [Ancylomarina sp. 16SWW S1-10-2]